MAMLPMATSVHASATSMHASEMVMLPVATSVHASAAQP
jgi:hypothetical protein